MALILPPKISFLEKLHMIGVVLGSVGYFIYALFFARLQGGGRKGYTLSTASSYFVRNLFARSSLRKLQWFLPSTHKAYNQFAKLWRFKPVTHTFPDGSMGHWMGNQSAKQIIVYLHGGGYMVPATLAHMKWVYDAQRELTKSGTDTSALILSYQLTPHGQYPLQLQQAVNLVKHVIEVEGLSPSQIILAGDSAGANLCLAVLSHLMHPHPAVPELKLSAPFRGVLLISPWIAFDYVEPIAKEYRWDMLSGPALRETSAAFIGPSPPDNYNEPVRAPPSWWEPLRDVTSSVYVYCGGAEMLKPSIEKIAQAMSDSVNLTLNIVPGATHVSTIVDNTVPGAKGVDKETLLWLKAQGEKIEV